MSWLRYFQRSKRDREQRAEIESYLEIETDENIARGLSPDQAREAARRKLGNPTRIREEIYEMNTVASLDAVARDVRHAARVLRRNPTFSLAGVLTLAIGVGANTAVFSVVNSVLLEPLPYPRPERLVAVAHAAPGAAGLAAVSGQLRLSASMYVTYAEQNRTFSDLGIWVPINSSVTGSDEPEVVASIVVSEGAVEALGVAPAVGRWLTPEEHQPGGPESVVLGYGFWQRRFGGDASALGRELVVNGRSRHIVGVTPRGFRFVDQEADLILPIGFNRGNLILPGFSYRSVARLRPGVSIADAASDLERLIPAWMSSWPAARGVDPKIYENWRITPTVRPLKDEVVGDAGSLLWVLMGTIGMVMVIAASNVANLLLVRAETRHRELAVRAALGAGRTRLMRESLVESNLLGLLGGAAGLALAYAGLRGLTALSPDGLPRLDEIGMDASAVAFGLAISLLAGTVLGLPPAWKGAGARISNALGSGGRTLSHSRERHRARNTLVVAQVALALVLLVSSGLMIRTSVALHNVEPGFTRADQIQTLRIQIPASRWPEAERVIRMQHDIADRLAAISGVEAVGFANLAPMGGPPDFDAVCTEHKLDAAEAIPPMRVLKYISPGYLEAMGIKMVAGARFAWSDLYDRRPGVIVSENLARELWGSPTAALGKRISTCLPQAPWRQVIGVVGGVRDRGLDEPPPAIVYWPAFGESIYSPGRTLVTRSVTYAVRSARAGAPSFHDEVSQAVSSVNPALPVASLRTMREVSQRSMERISFALVMLGIAGSMALLLGIVGIYGVISYVVSQRRREVGIRLTLGAREGEVRRMFAGYGLRLSGVGVAIGLAASVCLAPLMESLLFGVGPFDPLTYLLTPALLVGAAALASYLPARRAAGVNPVEVLKAE